MEKLRTEGIVIQATPFQDYDRILTLFTPEGLLKLFVKGAFSAKKGKGNSTAPLTLVEVIYTKGRGELCKSHEINGLNHHMALRKNLQILGAACDMLQVISATQMPEKATPELYQLLLAYLVKLPLANDPVAISTSFRLKVLRHEGLLGRVDECCDCGESLTQGSFVGPEFFCSHHAPSGNAIKLNNEELILVQLLAFSRDFNLLSGLNIDASLATKVSHLFATSI